MGRKHVELEHVGSEQAVPLSGQAGFLSEQTEFSPSSRFPWAVTWFGLLASIVTTLGGALAGAAALGEAGRLWAVPTIPVKPSVPILVALVLFYGGLIALVRAWLALRRHHFSCRLSPKWILLVAAIWAVPMLVGPPLGSRDVYAYAAQGRAATLGHNVYADGPGALGDDDPVLATVDPIYRDAPVVYGPLFVSTSSAVARFAGDGIVTAVLAFRLLAVLGLAVTGVAVFDLAKKLGADPVDALILTLANPLVLLHLVSGAHNEAIMLAFLVSGVAIGQRRKFWGVGLVLCSMAAAIKLPAALGVAFVAWPWVSRAASRVGMVGRALAAGGGALAVIGIVGRLTGWGWGWVDALTEADPVDAYLSVTRVLGQTVHFLTGLELSNVLSGARLLGFSLAVIVTAQLLIRGKQSATAALGWSLVLWAVLHPTTQPWYLTWGLMLIAASGAGQRNRLLVVGCTLAAFVVLPVGPQLGLVLLESSGSGAILFSLVGLTVLTLSPRLTLGSRPEVSSTARKMSDPRMLSIVVPTKCEEGSVAPLVDALAATDFVMPVELLFVDDSDDSTGRAVEQVRATATRENFDVRLLHRTPTERWGGLGGAVVDGLNNARGSIVAVMDSDLQHPPEAVARLVNEIRFAGAQVAVGSRNGVDGSVGSGLSPVRKAMSAAATWSAQLAFPNRLGRTDDPLSGLFAVDLDELDLNRLHPDGFKILVEILGTHPDLSVADVSYHFGQRNVGLSKASLSQGLRFLGHLVDLRLRTSLPWSGVPNPQKMFRSA